MSRPLQEQVSIPFCWLIVLCGWGWAAAALPSSTNAGWYILELLALSASFTVVGIGWCWISFTSPSIFSTKRLRWVWTAVPVLWIVVISLGSTDYGLAIRVWLCEDELRAFAESARTDWERNGVKAPPDSQVGLFHVQRTFGYGSEVNMITTRGLLPMKSFGITYCPGPGGAQVVGRYRHLYGPWYTFYDDF
jgi:hypothetical protein